MKLNEEMTRMSEKWRWRGKMKKKKDEPKIENRLRRTLMLCITQPSNFRNSIWLINVRDKMRITCSTSSRSVIFFHRHSAGKQFFAYHHHYTCIMYIGLLCMFVLLYMTVIYKLEYYLLTMQ